jgi:hypothetical protein
LSQLQNKDEEKPGLFGSDLPKGPGFLSKYTGIPPIPAWGYIPLTGGAVVMSFY